MIRSQQYCRVVTWWRLGNEEEVQPKEQLNGGGKKVKSWKDDTIQNADCSWYLEAKFVNIDMFKVTIK